MKFDEAHCHKWALLLKERKKKTDNALKAVASEDFDTAKKLVSEVFHGSNSGNGDPGMEGSLLYHMAMISNLLLPHPFAQKNDVQTSSHTDSYPMGWQHR